MPARKGTSITAAVAVANHYRPSAPAAGSMWMAPTGSAITAAANTGLVTETRQLTVKERPCLIPQRHGRHGGIL